MASMEVGPSPEYSEDNPYRAQMEIPDDSQYLQFGVEACIRPPVFLSDHYRELIFDDYGVSIKPKVTTAEGTLLWCDFSDDSSLEEPIVKVSETLRRILNSAGRIASKQLFDQS